MIPSLLDRQVRQGVADFVRTTFTITTPTFSDAVDRLCDTPGRMFKGPYVSLGLPFETGSAKADDFFPNLKTGFAPYRHQEMAWERLLAFQSTLVATGTGSGKTECFLYPVLEHVRHQRSLGWSGVKAILIYPMNALATDQARRLAKVIDQDPALKGKITAGLYVGGKQEKAARVMGPETLITDRKAIRLDPPDILLTNYKMLDYLLTRPKDRELWANNVPMQADRSATLRFLVVDELHSFDGAQGTDLALLIRRLKHRLGCGENQLCCVGTSATLGGPESTAQMLRYAGQIFGETFSAESLITEQRKEAKAFLEGTHLDLRGSGLPALTDLEKLHPEGYVNPSEYLRGQISLWFPGHDKELHSDRCALGQALCSHPVFRVLIEVVRAKARAIEEIRAEMARHFLEFDIERLRSQVSGFDAEDILRFQDLALVSLLALVAHARRPHPTEVGNLIPFVQQVRVQSWIRELRRMVAIVGTRPELDFADDLAGSGVKHLPLVYCRECGSAGWAGQLTSPTSDVLASSDNALRDFYKTYFQDRPSQSIRFLFPDLHKPNIRLCVSCLKLNTPERQVCGCGGKEFVPVHVPDSRFQDSKGRWFTRKHCPACGTHNSLVVLGAQASSLGSALINQLFASTYNDDKKLIAFSDNVQDASQRAAFFGARTWKFNFRAAIQQYLSAMHSADDGAAKSRQPLVGLGARVLAYWREQMQDDLATVALFLPSDLAYLDEAREAEEGERTSFSEKFFAALESRLDWEVFTEFGLDCRKGRTLEKSGCSIAQVIHPLSPAQLEEVCIRIQSLVPALRGHVDATEISRILNGMIRRWIHNGAILHPALEKYISELGNPFLIHKFSYWMKGFGRNSRTPSFPWKTLSGKDREGRLDPVETQPTKATSWYAHWLLKHWEQECPTLLSHYEELLPVLIGALEAAGIVIRNDIQGTTLWALNPDRLRIVTEVAHGRCHRCGHFVSFPGDEAEALLNMRCLKIGCTGRYQAHSMAGRYYGDLYSKGDKVRLHTQEHTSLLQREDREHVETRFKARGDLRKPWDPNLLSCTPTLEMGIDIGDLSSVLLCSVPPDQSAFVQRIGRAGRSDGNAWIGTIAEGQPHDLYFWADPGAMMHGRVEPPGVFLDATAVLERQMAAFCLDCWVRETPSAALPNKVHEMLNQRKRGQGFVSTWLDFVASNATKITDDFLKLLGSEATAPTQKHLQGFLNLTLPENTLQWKLNNSLDATEKNRNSLDQKRKQLDKDIGRLSKDAAANPDLIEEMRMEHDALTGLVKNLDERDTFQFLTDEGLIPNYAFPEAGVLLKSIIYLRGPARAGGVKSPRKLKKIFEYERAASAAISDFAPGNHFYAHGRKVQIDQIDPSLSQAEKWRLCPECGYMELEISGSMPAQCPQCQDPGFGGQQQVQDLLRVRQVFATSSDRSSRVGDDSDGREVRFFERALIVGLRASEMLGAWQIEDANFPFGFEVLRKVHLRELNFGAWITNVTGGGVLRVAGKDVASGGFELCKFCGKVKVGASIEHSFHCKQQHPKDDQKILQAVLFYRDLESEALRVFLPTLAPGSEEDAKSFLAALHLGLRLHYQGDISHLQATLQSEPVPSNVQVRKHFVVLYDTVPGGTGYLRQFRDSPQLLIEVLRLALLRMTACRCNQIPDKDGCYLCLLAHRNSREMDLISRTKAVSLLRKITAPNLTLKAMSKGLSAISLHSLLESELESRFLQALQAHADSPIARHKVRLAGTLEGGGNAWNLTVGEETWRIHPQVVIQQKDGVAVYTRADFVVTHSANKVLPIALYLDGWEYHHARMEIDTRQRLALHRSGKFRIWTLSWEDLNDLQKPMPMPSGLLGVANPSGYESFLAKLGQGHNPDWNTFGSMRLFLEFLAKPEVDHWKLWGYAVLMGNVISVERDPVAWEKSVGKWLPKRHSGWRKIWPGMASRREGGMLRMDAWLGQGGPDQSAVLLRANDASISQGESKQEWMDFWRTVNMLQFQPDLVFVSEEAASNGAYDDLPMREDPTETGSGFTDSDWQELWSLVQDFRLRELMAHLYRAQLPIPEAFHEVVEGGMVLAATDIAWPNLKIAVVSDTEDFEACARLGWKTMEKEHLDAAVILAWLKGK